MFDRDTVRRCPVGIANSAIPMREQSVSKN